MTTEEGNKLIAEYMQYGYEPNFGKGYYVPDDTNGPARSFVVESKLKFHSSWDWLMPVVEKIDSLGYETEILSYNDVKDSSRINQCVILQNNNVIVRPDAKTKIEATWQAVVDFIQWHNSTVSNPDNK